MGEKQMVEASARAICRIQLAQSGQFGRRGIEKQTDKYWHEWKPEAYASLYAAGVITPPKETPDGE
jgi:hypothetical protein